MEPGLTGGQGVLDLLRVDAELLRERRGEVVALLRAQLLEGGPQLGGRHADLAGQRGEVGEGPRAAGTAVSERPQALQRVADLRLVDAQRLRDGRDLPAGLLDALRRK